MHILHVETGRHLYGGALQVLYLMQGLRREGCRNTLICAAGGEIAGAAEGVASIHEIPMAGEMDPAFLFRLWSITRRILPDIIHLHSRRGADLWGVVAAHLAGTKVVLTRRVDNPEPRWLARSKYGLCDRVITISEGIRRVLLSEGAPGHRIVCVPSAVDTTRYGRTCEKEWFHEAFGLPPDSRAVGVIAQFIPRKGHRHLLEVVPVILARHPDVHFLLFGQGPSERQLKGLCRTMRIEDHVHFPGFRRDLERILPCLNLVVHPALMEGLGVALLQAAASGLPIVATRVGGIPEVVRHGVNGYLVGIARKDELIHSVLALLEDSAKAKSFGKAGRELVHARFSIEEMVKGNREVYQELLGGKAGRDVPGHGHCKSTTAL